MSLPILSSRSMPETLLRLFHQACGRMAHHIAEAEQLDVGTAYTNPELPLVHDANHVRDAALPEGMSPADALAQVDAFFEPEGVRCAYWVMNPSAPAAAREPLIEHLLAGGHTALALDVLSLDRIALPAAVAPADLKIIPARASFAHSRALFEIVCQESAYPAQVADAAMMHLDDPQWDALLALKGGEPAAFAGVLAFGELGLIEDVYVAPAFRRQGLARLMMIRILDICARSLFKHIMLSVLASNAPAQALYAGLGFKKIGEMTQYKCSR